MGIGVFLVPGITCVPFLASHFGCIVSYQVWLPMGYFFPPLTLGISHFILALRIFSIFHLKYHKSYFINNICETGKIKCFFLFWSFRPRSTCFNETRLYQSHLTCNSVSAYSWMFFSYITFKHDFSLEKPFWWYFYFLWNLYAVCGLKAFKNSSSLKKIVLLFTGFTSKKQSWRKPLKMRLKWKIINISIDEQNSNKTKEILIQLVVFPH
jgi:hypothetical protein